MMHLLAKFGDPIINPSKVVARTSQFSKFLQVIAKHIQVIRRVKMFVTSGQGIQIKSDIFKLNRNHYNCRIRLITSIFGWCPCSYAAWMPATYQRNKIIATEVITIPILPEKKWLSRFFS